MAEATQSAADQIEAEAPEFDREKDLANLKRIGGWHASAVVAALTLFGAGHTWAATTDWLLANTVSIAAAVLAAMVISSIGHEWGHFSGARLSGAISPVPKKPSRLYFMFRFDLEQNSTRQFLWMSWGGLLGSWSLVLMGLVLVPLDSWASAMLISVLLGRAVNATAFEYPIIQRAGAGVPPAEALKVQFETTGLRKLPGLVVGLLALAVLS